MIIELRIVFKETGCKGNHLAVEENRVPKDKNHWHIGNKHKVYIIISEPVLMKQDKNY